MYEWYGGTFDVKDGRGQTLARQPFNGYFFVSLQMLLFFVLGNSHNGTQISKLNGALM